MGIRGERIWWQLQRFSAYRIVLSLHLHELQVNYPSSHSWRGRQWEPKWTDKSHHWMSGIMNSVRSLVGKVTLFNSFVMLSTSKLIRGLSCRFWAQRVQLTCVNALAFFQCVLAMHRTSLLYVGILCHTSPADTPSRLENASGRLSWECSCPSMSWSGLEISSDRIPHPVQYYNL